MNSVRRLEAAAAVYPILLLTALIILARIQFDDGKVEPTGTEGVLQHEEKLRRSQGPIAWPFGGETGQWRVESSFDHAGHFKRQMQLLEAESASSGVQGKIGETGSK